MPEPGYDIGAAWLTVIPAFRGVQKRVQQEARGWGKVAGQEFQKAFDAEVRKPSKVEPGPSRAQSQKQGSDVGGAFADGFRRRVEAAARSLPPIQITAASSQAEQKLRDLREDLDDLSRKTVGVDIDAGTAQAELDRLDRELDRLGSKSPDVQVRADTALAQAQLRALQAQVAALDAKDVDIRVDIDDFGTLNSYTGRLSMLIATGMAIAPAIVPAAGAATAALMAIGPAAASGAAGLGVLAMALSGISDAVKALGDQQVNAASDAQDAARKQATAANSVASAARQVESAEASLTNARADAANAARQAADRVADAQRGVRRAEVDAAQASEAAARQVQDARRAAADATQDAARQVEDALERQEQAERRLSDAQRDATRAQQDLLEARQQAARDIEDLDFDVRGGRLREQQAALDLAEAQERVNKLIEQGRLLRAEDGSIVPAGFYGGAPDREAAEAALRLRQQQLDLEELRVRNKRLAEEQAEARRKGIEGSERVQSAQDRVRQAIEAQTQAQRELGDAAEAVDEARAAGARRVAEAQAAVVQAQRDAARVAVEGQERVADAHRRVTEAVAAQAEQQRQSAHSVESAQRQVEAAHAAAATAAASLAAAQGEVSTSTEKVQEAMDKLGPAGQDFATFIFGLRGAWMDLKSAAEGVLPGIQAGIEALLPHLPAVTDFVSTLADVMGDLAERAGKALAGPLWTPFMSMMSRISAPMIEAVAVAIGNFALGLANLFVAFEPLTEQVIGGLVSMMEDFARWSAGLGENNGFQAFLGYIHDTMPDVVAFLGAFFAALGNIIEAMAPFGPVVLGIATAFANMIAAMPPGLLAAISLAILGIVAALGPLSIIISKVLGVVMAVKAGMTLWAAVMAVLGGPITLVIAGIAALTGALIAAYYHSETFRNIVDTAFRWVGKAAVWLWRSIIKPYFTFILGLWTTVFGWVRFTGWPWLRDSFQWVGDKAEWLWKKGIKAAFDKIKTLISNDWDAISDSLADFRAGIGKVADAFDSAQRGIGRAWDKIKAGVSKPIVAVLRFVNDPLLVGLNKVLDWVGMDKIDPIPVPAALTATPAGAARGAGAHRAIALADGGIMPGYTPGRDVHTFISPTGGLLHLSGGEPVLRPEAGAVLGREWVDAINAAARTRGQEGVKTFLSGSFSTGGVIGAPSGGNFMDWLSERIKGAWSWAGDKAGTIRDLATNPVEAIKRIGRSLLEGISGGPFGGIISGFADKMLGGLGGKIADWLSPAGATDGGRIPAGGWSSSQIVALAKALDPFAIVTSTFRPGAITASGFPSFHGLDRAADFVSANMARLFNTLRATGIPWSELYYSPIGFMRRGRMVPRSQVSPVTIDNHYSHVHAALADGGFLDLSKVLLRDQGGPIPPGLHAVMNGTNKTEWVLNDEQIRAVGAQTSNAGTPVIGAVHFHDSDDPRARRDGFDQLVFTMTQLRHGSLAERRG